MVQMGCLTGPGGRAGRCVRARFSRDTRGIWATAQGDGGPGALSRPEAGTLGNLLTGCLGQMTEGKAVRKRMRDHPGEALGLRGGAGGERQREGSGPGGEDMPTGPIWNPHTYWRGHRPTWNPHTYCRGHRPIWNPHIYWRGHRPTWKPHIYCRGHRPIRTPTSTGGVPGPSLQDLMGPLPHDPGAA